MPKGDLGRIGLAIARSNPSIVYALVEAEKSALLRSDDGGRNWKAVNTEHNVANRPFYYADIRVDPADPNRVYNVYSLVSLSTDGGKIVQDADPVREDPSRLSRPVDRSERRRRTSTPATTAASRRARTAARAGASSPRCRSRQYYHVAVDNETSRTTSTAACRTTARGRGRTRPGRPAASATGTGRKSASATASTPCPIPTDPMTGYAMSQEGYLVRWNLRTGERKDIRPAPPDRCERTCASTGTPAIALDPFDPNGVYFGSQYVHKSTNRGDTWTIISPDLTTQSQGVAEAGQERRPHARRHRRGELHDHHHHRAEPARARRDLGRHRRRPRARHARRRRELDERRGEHQGRAREHLGAGDQGLAPRRRRRRSSCSTTTAARTGRRTSTARPTTARPGRRSRRRTCRATRSRSSRTRSIPTCSSSARSSASG